MITMEKILCPVDFFPASDEAVTYAAGLAANYDASIHLLHVVTPIAVGTYEYAIDTDEIMRSMEEKSMEQLNKLVARVKKAGVAVTSELRTGDVYEEIKGSIVDVKPDLIVMGTHGRRGVERWFIGSTTEKLLRHSPVPLVKQLEGLVPAGARNWCEIVTRVETGIPYRIILRTLEDEKVDLLIMNIHGKDMLDRALLGSTAERVVRAASCPVMMIPPMNRKGRMKARPGEKRVGA